MNKFVCAVSAVMMTMSVSSSMAATYTVTGPEPVQTYTVCEHMARYLVNDHAVRLRSGGQSLTISGGAATVTRTPDVFLQTSRLISNSYQSLSPDGNCPGN